MAFKGAFGLASFVLGAVLKMPAEFVALDDREARTLAAGWKPVADHYKVNLGMAPMWANAIGATFEVLGPKLQEGLKRRNLPRFEVPPAAGAEPEPRPGGVPA